MSIQKMYMVSPEELQSMKGKKDKELEMLKYNEAFHKNKAAEKIEEENEWKKLSDRLKPLFGQVKNNEVQSIIDSFPTGDQAQVSRILNLLNGIPDVKIENGMIKVYGKVEKDSPQKIIGDILKNGIMDSNSIIDALRGKKKKKKKTSLASSSIHTPFRTANDSSFQDSPGKFGDSPMFFTPKTSRKKKQVTFSSPDELTFSSPARLTPAKKKILPKLKLPRTSTPYYFRNRKKKENDNNNEEEEEGEEEEGAQGGRGGWIHF